MIANTEDNALFSDDAQRHYQAMQMSCAVCDLEGRTQIELTGADRQRFLHNLCTNDIVRLAPGDGCEAFATNVQGKCVGHLFVMCQEKSLRVSTVAGQAESLMAHWDRYLITEDVEMQDCTASRRELLIAGPQSSVILSRLGIPSPPSAILANGEVRIGAVTCGLTRTPLVATENYVLSYPVAAHDELQIALANAGAAVADPNVTWQAFEAARLEHRFPWYGRDIDNKTLPQEVNRDAAAISFKKGCYLGQETVARIDALGHVNRLLTLLQVSSTIPTHGAPLSVDAKTAGEITSAAYSPKFASFIALAYVRCDAARPGTRLTGANFEASVLSPESAAS